MIKIKSTVKIVSILDVFAVLWLRIVAWIFLLRPLEILLGWCGYYPFQIDLYRYTALAKVPINKYAAALLVDQQQLLTHEFQLNETMKMLDELRQTEFKASTMYAFAHSHRCCTRLHVACRIAARMVHCTPCGRLRAASGVVHIAAQCNTTPSTLRPFVCI